MENEEFDSEHYIKTAGMGKRILPVQATELLGGIGSQILRSLLVASPDSIREEYACSPEEAAEALKCCDLAELLAWDETALIDAATVGGEEEARVMWGLESRDAIARRVSLAIKAEKAPDVMSPAEGVLLLRRAGIHVFHQLLDAVAVMAIEPFTIESQSLYRQMKGIPETQRQAQENDTSVSAQRAAVDDVPTKRKANKPSIEKVALDYMRKEYLSAHFQSAAKFHKHLIKTAGVNDSPFVKGDGLNAGKLFCPAASSFYDAGTLGKIWAKIRAK